MEIRNVYIGKNRKMIIKAAKRIFNSDKICRDYSDVNFGVTFFGTQCRLFHTCEQAAAKLLSPKLLCVIK